jgi:hypothetical protein
MIAPDTVDWILRLLAEAKHSHRAIAKTTGVSRATIGAMSRGHVPRRGVARDSAGGRTILGVPIRCPKCGGKINVMPCVFCDTTAIADRRRAVA